MRFDGEPWNGFVESGIYAKLEFSDNGTQLLNWVIGKKGLAPYGTVELTKSTLGTQADFFFKTDAAGNVTDWNLATFSYLVDGYIGMTTRFNPGPSAPPPDNTTDSAVAAKWITPEFLYYNGANPGTWTRTGDLPHLALEWHAAPVPELDAAAMLAGGLGMVGWLTGRRRRTA